MKAPKNEKPTLHLTGPAKGPPTVDDIMQLYKDLTGREPTPEEYASVKAKIDAHIAKLAKEAR